MASKGLLQKGDDYAQRHGDDGANDRHELQKKRCNTDHDGVMNTDDRQSQSGIRADDQ